MDFAAHGLNTEFAADLSKCILFIFPKIFFPRNPDHEPRLVAGLQGWFEKCSSPTGDGNYLFLSTIRIHNLRNVVPRQGTETSDQCLL